MERRRTNVLKKKNEQKESERERERARERRTRVHREEKLPRRRWQKLFQGGLLFFRFAVIRCAAESGALMLSASWQGDRSAWASGVWEDEGVSHIIATRHHQCQRTAAEDVSVVSSSGGGVGLSKKYSKQERRATKTASDAPCVLARHSTSWLSSSLLVWSTEMSWTHDATRSCFDGLLTHGGAGCPYTSNSRRCRVDRRRNAVRLSSVNGRTRLEVGRPSTAGEGVEGLGDAPSTLGLTFVASIPCDEDSKALVVGCRWMLLLCGCGDARMPAESRLRSNAAWLECIIALPSAT